MKPSSRLLLSKLAFPTAVVTAALLGWWTAAPTSPAIPQVAASPPFSNADTERTSGPAPDSPSPVADPSLAAKPAKAKRPLPVDCMSLEELRVAWGAATTFETLQTIAQELAARNTEDSVRMLVSAISTLDDRSMRAELSKNLRAVSDPATLPALLPALLNEYGRGNTILNEIADAVGRMAQPDTVETLAVMHWQASTQTGQSHKILRTVAGIRNPPALRGLLRLAERSESPALSAAATEALQNLKPETL